MSSLETYFDFDDSNKRRGDAPFDRFQFIRNTEDKGTSLPFVWLIYKEQVFQTDEESQILESLSNLENGNYVDFTIEEYLKEIDQ